MEVEIPSHHLSWDFPLIINHPFGGTPIYGNPHVSVDVIHIISGCTLVVKPFFIVAGLHFLVSHHASQRSCMEGEAIELCPSDNDSGIVFTAVENNMLDR